MNWSPLEFHPYEKCRLGGSEKKGIEIVMNNNPSREITIVSITKNDPDGIKRTVQSVLMQDFVLWRLVIVISNEKDTSFEYVKNLCKKHQNINYLIPESPGIYEAMNFALDRYNPELTWFLNGGDVLQSTSTLSKAYVLMESYKPSILMGGYEISEDGSDHQYVRPARQVTARTFSLNIRSGNHQAMLFDFTHFKKNRFITELRLAADFLLILEILKEKPGLRVKEVFSKIDPCGVSSRMIEEVWVEKQIARREVFGNHSVDTLLGNCWTLAAKSKRTLKSYPKKSKRFLTKDD